MKLPNVKSILLVEDEWYPDSDRPAELILRSVNGERWSVSVMQFNYIGKINDRVKFEEVSEGY